MNRVDDLFRYLTGYSSPREFQGKTIQTILDGHNALLRAPTGSGKTETAIAPFLFAKLPSAKEFKLRFPKKLIYVVPLRTLANSLRTRAEKLIASWSKQYKTSRQLVVTLQTGENPEDPRFEGDIVFCTIDQMLSSFLNIPYSVGRGSANVNSGAIFTSYLVFDELHLLDPDRSFATLLKVLEQVKGISPFLLMTATLTDQLVKEIQTIDKGIKTISVEPLDLREIEGERQRTFQAIDTPLSAELILKDIQQYKRKRVIILCNTVSHSQGIFQDLEALDRKGELEITLLHSRFLAEDRKYKENNLETDFGKDWQSKNNDKCYVLISTQVIEVGINITCEIMHTYLCPMSSLLQRAGRCARFGGFGEVKVYREILISNSNSQLVEADLDEHKEESTNKKRRFLPYKDDICHLTWDVLKKHDAARSVGFQMEFQWVNDVHQGESELQIKRRQNDRSEFLKQFKKAIFRGDQSASRELIRNIDNRNIFVSPEQIYIDGEYPEVPIDQLEPFSLPTNTLYKALNDFKKVGHQTWLFKRIESPSKEKAETYSQPICVEINSRNDITTSLRILVNPNFVFYNERIGLRIVPNPDSEQENELFTSKQKEKKSFSNQYKYYMDTYEGHLGFMWKCWRETFTEPSGEKRTFASVRDEMRDSGGDFIKQKIFTEASIEKTSALFEILVFLAIMTHDLGKLQVKWQQVMRGWQMIAHQNFGKTNPADHLLAHTDYDPNNTELYKAYKAYMETNKRPPHAIESAFLSGEVLQTYLIPILENCFKADQEDITNIADVVIMASGRHHSAWTNGWDLSDAVRIKQIVLHPEANRVIARSWKGLSTSLQQLLPDTITLSSEAFKLSQTSYETDEIKLDCFNHDYLKYQQLYALVVRALRLCDMRSVQINH